MKAALAAVRKYIIGRVARRFFLVFIICAFLPLAAVSILSYMQVRSMVLAQADQRLASVAKSYGMTLFERMLVASDIASAAAGRAVVPDEALATGESLEERSYRALVHMLPDGRTRPLLGMHVPAPLRPEELVRLLAGKPVVRVTGGTAKPQVELVAAVPAPGQGFVAGILRPEWLWGSEDELPAVTNFCILEDRWRTVIQCTMPMPAAAMEGKGEFVRDGEKYRSRSWTQFMRGAFGTPDWTIVAAQPESYPLAKAREFARMYVPAILLTLLLVGWLTLRQSRDIVGPLEKLAQRARGVGGSDFGGKLDLHRDDELGELAVAFDQMSSKLGDQFATLSALSEIDRLILTTQDTARVTQTVLQRLAEVTHAEDVTVLLFDGESDDYARMYYLDKASEAATAMERQRFDHGARSIMGLQASDWPRLDLAELPAFLQPLAQRGLQGAFVQPVVWRGAVCGAVLLGFRDPRVASPQERGSVGELADRIAVAVSSEWRDKQLYEQSHFDMVTGVPNRLLFRDRLSVEIVRSGREQLRFALLFIDLDHFKHVNDSFGHSIGDAVLRETAERLLRCVRSSDSIARIGGDEFTVLLTNLHQPQEAWLVAETIVESLAREFIIGEQRCFLSASIGIATYPDDGTSEEILIKSADTAMYRAKGAGRAQAVFFEEGMNRETIARVALDRDLRVAIERGELALHYQPQVALADGRVTGAEALVRWNHPVHGWIAPTRFIPLAEESGFIETLGQWVIREACRQMKDWRAAGLPLERVSVNVSPRQFRRRGIVDYIARCVEDAGIPPASLEIEVTEGLLMDRGEMVEALLTQLAAMGHGIALDDFGTGFSSMAYLKRFPVHLIKIDRVFVDGLRPGTDSSAIVAAIIAMAHALGKRVVAEGVETFEQQEILRALQCDEIQGFLVATALPAADLAAFVASRSFEALPA